MNEHHDANPEELTNEEERMRRVWKRTLEEIRKINEAYSNPQYSSIGTKTLAGTAYYNALLQYAHTTKFSRLPEVYDTELYEVCAPVYKYGGRKIERQFYFLLMRKFCSPYQEKDSFMSQELAKRNPKARIVIYKRYFEEKTFSAIEAETQINAEKAKRLCSLAMKMLNY